MRRCEGRPAENWRPECQTFYGRLSAALRCTVTGVRPTGWIGRMKGTNVERFTHRCVPPKSNTEEAHVETNERVQKRLQAHIIGWAALAHPANDSNHLLGDL